MAVHPRPLPPQALLAKHAGTGFTDCYTAQVARPVSQAQFVEAFYTGGVFRIERLLIALFLSRPSSDEQVRQLAQGALREFAAWRVEEQTPDQLLLCDITGRTRSWLMVTRDGSGSTLWFGSGVGPKGGHGTGQRRMGWVFHALLGFHKLYSRVLLGAAHSRLASSR